MVYPIWRTIYRSVRKTENIVLPESTTMPKPYIHCPRCGGPMRPTHVERSSRTSVTLVYMCSCDAAPELVQEPSGKRPTIYDMLQQRADTLISERETISAGSLAVLLHVHPTTARRYIKLYHKRKASYEDFRRATECNLPGVCNDAGETHCKY